MIDQSRLYEVYKLTALQKFYVLFKSSCDFFIGLIWVILLMPFFLIMAIIIKLDTKGPVFFKQKRVGKNKKLFTCLKFRSMSVSAPKYAIPCELDSKSYITKVGAFMRKTSIDELPQLFCLITGKMSLIGYRPCIESEVELINERTRYGVHTIKPGLTGLAQINGRDILSANPTKKAMFDGCYYQNLSLIQDVKILFKTVKNVLVSKDVVEGFEAKTQAENFKK